MPFVPVPNVAQVELVYSVDGQICENTFYAKNTQAFTASTLNLLAAAFKDWFNIDYKAQMSSAVSLDVIKARGLDTVSSPGVEYVTGLPIAGARTATPLLPNNVTVAITFLTALRGRSYRGRNYLIGLCEGDVALNQITTGFRTSVLAAYDGLITRLNTATYPLVVVSRRTQKAWRTTGVATDCTGFKMDLTIDSMRKRLPGRGS